MEVHQCLTITEFQMERLCQRLTPWLCIQSIAFQLQNNSIPYRILAGS